MLLVAFDDHVLMKSLIKLLHGLAWLTNCLKYWSRTVWWTVL